MGWIHEDMPGHEGYLVAVVEREMSGSGDWRELGRGAEKARDVMQADKSYDHAIAVRTVQVACECGWRSARIDAPIDTVWVPFVVESSEQLEAEAFARWRAHIAEEEGRESTLCARGRHALRDRWCPSTIGEPCIQRGAADPAPVREHCYGRPGPSPAADCRRCGAPAGLPCIDPHGKKRAPHASRGAW